ncbi:MAG TPA: hypothetical protein VED46_13885 [Alphaproteobacteria bacterium]|nr:hypothetical protein [Alphaproteobacteria bacterium]
MAEAKKERVAVSKLLDAALKSGIIDAKVSLADIASRFGPDIEEVAGYVVAWERYVLVVGSATEPEIVIRQADR